MTSTDPDQPSTLQLGVTPQMESAAAELCDLKILMDRQSRSDGGQPFINDWMNVLGGTCAFHGDTFLRLVVPFLLWTSREDEKNPWFRAYVDPQHVLGASIKGGPGSVREDEVASRIEQYAHDFDGDPPRPQYVWIQPLGILCAHEGKHRVAFMRALAQPAIAAWVKQRGYPAPDRIRLIEPDPMPGKRDEWLALLDDRYLQVVQRPAITRMMLNAYGVKTIRWRDVPNAPSEGFVRREIHTRRLHLGRDSRSESDRTLDLREVGAKETRASEELSVSLLDLANYGWRLRSHAVYLSAIVMSIAGVGVAQLQNSKFQLAGMLFVGIGIGLAIAGNLFRFVGKRGQVSA